ncbi:hypothetical protein JF546_13165 [Nitratireductor aquimarinus]|uniref:DUF6161 domain-containing protein n=1 Tax=Nitratireductor aquimarinus TaxID=889300 RepID=UPI001A8F4D06|nr:DUF6161 domain-containing protein [Nitratireductor aquimarinus]MBN8243965.1 hypothetical protein [Nitratireductor aquimarinus]MBY6131499.1 hypothetical protein [Nitratireductor aquimarinus]MCA1301035.1 hypothetical protein [Nitratireductor aquimarinus]
MAVESKDGSLPVRLLLEKQRFRKTFRTLDEVEAFLRDEASFWTSVTQHLSKNSINQMLSATYSNITKVAERSLSRFLGNRTDRTAITELEQLEKGHAIISTGLYGSQIAKCVAENPMAVPGLVFAIHATLNFHNSPPIPNAHTAVNHQDIASLSAGLIELAGAKIKGKHQRDIHEGLIDELQHAREEFESERLEFQSWKNRHTALSEGELEKFKSDATGQLSEMNGSLSTCLSESQGRIAELEQQVRDRLVLEAPTTYWRNKARNHYVAAGSFGVLFIVVLGVGIYWLLAHGLELVAAATAELVRAQPDATLSLLVPLVFITLPALAAAWVLRHISRVVVQNLSLAADASLRGTIATTYSALTFEKDATDAQLALALQALFRPVDGNSHAEIAPPNIQDVLELAGKK